jgi:integrase
MCSPARAVPVLDGYVAMAFGFNRDGFSEGEESRRNRIARVIDALTAFLDGHRDQMIELRETTRVSVRDIAVASDLRLSASVQKYPSEMMVTNGSGTDRCGPWIIDRAIRGVREQIDGLPEGFSFHDLRHYLASLLIASGADIKTVQARMRHQSARTTPDTYSHLWPDADESTRTAVGAVIADRLASLDSAAY